MAAPISQQELYHLTNVSTTVKEILLNRGRPTTEGEKYWLRHCSDTLRIAKHQCEHTPIPFDAAHAPHYFHGLTELLVLLVDSLQPGDVLPGEICLCACATREEALQQTREHQSHFDGDQRVETRGEPVRHHCTEWYEHYMDRAVHISLGLTYARPRQQQICSDDKSTRLHIHDCDVRDDAEEVSKIYAG